MVSELKQIEDILDDENEARKAELAELIVQKTDAIVYFNKSQDDLKGIIKARIKELQDFKKIVDNRESRFDRYIIECLKTLGIKKLSGQLNMITLRDPVQKVIIYDESVIDPRFIRIKKEVDLQAIKEAIKNGEEVDGAKLEYGEHSVLFKVGK